MKTIAIVPAAGAGSRFKKKGRKKPFFIIRNKPILIHTLLALESSGEIDDIIVAVGKNDIAKWKFLFRRFGLKKIRGIVPGGKTRFESVKNALTSAGASGDIILIHDGVRPFVNKRIIADSISACRAHGAAIAAVPVIATVKFVKKGSVVRSTPDRSRLFSAQTPQVFKREVILKGYNEFFSTGRNVTDDSVLVERLGHKVKVVPGSYENIKITTPRDLILAEAMLK